jgi:hypothetical protein
MPTYPVNPTDPNSPTDQQGAKQGAEEFRALKAHISSLSGNHVIWNPVDKHTGISLSGASLVATKNIEDGFYRSVRANYSVAAGKLFWEITINAIGAQRPIVGIGQVNSSLETNVGGDAYGYGYGGVAGNKYEAGVVSAYGTALGVGDVVGVALDITGLTVNFYKNNAALGAIAIPAGKSWFPMASLFTLNTQLTANFGEQAFTYGPPVGYTSLSSAIFVALGAYASTMIKQFFPTF